MPDVGLQSSRLPRALVTRTTERMDRRYNRALWKHGLIEAGTFEERLWATDIEENRRTLIRTAARRHRRETRRN